MAQNFANDTIQLLRQVFGGQKFSRNGDVNWPPRSCAALFFLYLCEKAGP